jgi:DNA-binding MurR/RpiR family transcriptional regulator
VSKRPKRAERPTRPQQAKPESVIDGLRRQYDKLTQSQKRIAEYIVDHPESVAFSTVDQMATELGINPSTIVRFTYRLGLKGFPELQERARQLVRGQLSAATEIVNENSVLSHLEGTIFGASLGQDLQNIRRTIAALNTQDLTRAAEMIAKARRVFVAGSYASYAVAYYLALALDRIHGNTTLCGDTGMMPSQSLDLRPSDCMVAFTSAPYAVTTHRLAQLAREGGAKIIAVTDTPISAVGQMADLILSAPSAGSGMQNSLVAPLAIANALLNGVAGADSPATLARYGRLTKLMNRWDAFLLKGEEGETP